MGDQDARVEAGRGPEDERVFMTDERFGRPGIGRLARGVGIAVATIPILLALDVFGQGESGSLVEVGMIHVALSIPLILALLAAWVRPRWGAVAYVALGLAYGAALMSRVGVLEVALFAGPLIVLAALFWLAGPTETTP